MPRVKQRIGAGFSFVPETEPTPLPDPTLGETMGAAFSVSNDVVAAWDLISRPRFKPDPNFNVVEGLKRINRWEDRQSFVGVQSEEEMLAIDARMTKQQKHRETLARAGWGGVAAGMFAGVVSPTSLIPLTAGARGAKALAEGAAIGFGVGAFQEGVLYAADETYQPSDAIAGIAAATVLGGALGGAASYLSTRALRRAEYDMVNSPGETAIQPLFIQGTDDGAQIVVPTAGNYRFSRAQALDLESPEPISIRAEPDGPTNIPYELRADRTLVVSPESIRVIREELGDVTEEALLRFAREQELDAVVFEGLDEIEGAVEQTYAAQRVRYSELTEEDRALVDAGLGRELRKKKDGTPRADARVSREEIAELRRKETGVPKIDDQVVVLDKSKLRQTDDVDIPPTMPRFGTGVASVSAEALGAASTRAPFAGRLKAGAGNWLSFVSPVTRVIQGPSRQAAWMMQQMSSAGLVMERNAQGVPTARGGTVEARKETWMGHYYVAHQRLTEAYNNYVFNGKPPGRFENIKAAIEGHRNPAKLNRAEFNREVGKAVFTNKHEIPEVLEAVKGAREAVYEIGLKEMQSVKLLPEEIDLVGDLFYGNRVYNKEVIRRRTQEFMNIFADHFNTKLVADFRTRLEAFREAKRQTEEAIEDLQLTPEEVLRVSEEMKADLRELDDIASGAGKVLTPVSGTFRLKHGTNVADPAGHTFRQGYDYDEGGYFGNVFGDEGSIYLAADNKWLDGSMQLNYENVIDVEFNPKKMLVLSPDTLPLIKRELGEETVDGEALAKWAKENGYDSLAVQGFDQQLANTTERYGQTPGNQDMVKFDDLLPEDKELVTRYFTQQYDSGFTNKNVWPDRDAFVEAMTEEISPGLLNDYRAELEGLNSNMLQDQVVVFDPSIVKNLGTSSDRNVSVQFPSGFRETPTNPTIQGFIQSEDEVAELRAAARATDDPAERKLLRDQARELARALRDREGYGEFARRRTDRRRRLRNLNRNRFVLEEKQRKKLDKIDRAEELNLRALNRAARAGQRALRELERVSDRKLDAVVSRLRSTFADVARKYDAGEERIVALAADESEADLRQLGLDEQGRQEVRFDRLTEIAERLEEAEGLDRAGLRALIDEGMQLSLERINRINSRRAVRSERLRQQAADLDPSRVDAEVERLRARVPELQFDFLENMRLRGADDVDLGEGVADFSAHAMKLAEELKDRILGEHVRLPGLDILQGPRGPELQRMLDIESEKIFDFLETDIELMMRAYIRTVAPDVEMVRKFGSVNADGEFIKLREERNNALRKLAEDYSGEELEKRTRQLNSDYEKLERDLTGIIMRVRNTWGIPDNPEGWAARAAAVVRNLNVLRFMGMVTVASVPDVSRSVQRFGFQRAFGDGFRKFTSDLKTIELMGREAKLAGVALDVTLHTTMRRLYDVAEDVHRGTKFERGIEYATSKMGIVAGYDFWTSGLKQMNAGIINAKMMDSIDLVMNGNGTAKEISDATEFLNDAGIDAGLARRIFEEVTKPDGGVFHNGMWIPNTQNWDPEIARTYRAALAYNVNNTIITPGLELPLVLNETVAGRLLFQFKSFMLSSTTKTLMAGLQQNDAAFYMGTVFSLSLGALSWYLRAVMVGGQTYEEMINASPERWLDEAIDRSGNLAALGLVRETMQDITPIGKVTQGTPLGIVSQFSEEGSTRRGGRGLTQSVLGPSFDFLSRSSQVLNDLDDPTQSTMRTAAGLAPGGNLPYLRLKDIFEAIGDAAGLPEDRR